MSPRLRIRVVAAAATAVIAMSPSAAAAHSGLVARRDLPVPEWLFAWAAAAVLAASFIGLAALWQRPKLEASRERVIGRLPRWLDSVCGAVGVALFALVVVAGFAGTDNPVRNVAPTFVFVVFWVGLAIVCAIFGDLFFGRSIRGERSGVPRLPLPNAPALRASPADTRTHWGAGRRRPA